MQQQQQANRQANRLMQAMSNHNKEMRWIGRVGRQVFFSRNIFNAYFEQYNIVKCFLSFQFFHTIMSVTCPLPVLGRNGSFIGSQASISTGWAIKLYIRGKNIFCKRLNFSKRPFVRFCRTQLDIETVLMHLEENACNKSICKVMYACYTYHLQRFINPTVWVTRQSYKASVNSQ